LQSWLDNGVLNTCAAGARRTAAEQLTTSTVATTVSLIRQSAK